MTTTHRYAPRGTCGNCGQPHQRCPTRGQVYVKYEVAKPKDGEAVKRTRIKGASYSLCIECANVAIAAFEQALANYPPGKNRG